MRVLWKSNRVPNRRKYQYTAGVITVNFVQNTYICYYFCSGIQILGSEILQTMRFRDGAILNTTDIGNVQFEYVNQQPQSVAQNDVIEYTTSEPPSEVQIDEIEHT